MYTNNNISPINHHHKKDTDTTLDFFLIHTSYTNGNPQVDNSTEPNQPIISIMFYVLCCLYI